MLPWERDASVWSTFNCTMLHSLLFVAPMHCWTTSAAEPRPTHFTLCHTLLLTHWSFSLSNTLVSSLVTFLPLTSPTHATLHFSHRCVSWSLGVWPGSVSSTSPFPPILGHTVPVVSNLHSLQVLLHHISPSTFFVGLHKAFPVVTIQRGTTWAAGEPSFSFWWGILATPDDVTSA